MKRLAFVWCLFALVLACNKNPPDTSQLSPQGKQDLQRLNVIKVVNDASTAVIAANKATPQAASDTLTARVLTANKQVLDVIQANPTGYKDLALTAARNARDALPADLQALFDKYVSAVISALQAVQ